MSNPYISVCVLGVKSKKLGLQLVLAERLRDPKIYLDSWVFLHLMFRFRDHMLIKETVFGFGLLFSARLCQGAHLAQL